MLPAQNLRPESLLFVLATESRALNVVATSATTICFVSRNLIPKEIIKLKSHTPYYDKSNAKALLTNISHNKQKATDHFDLWLFVCPESISVFPDKHCICGHKYKIRHTSFEIYRISKNCPLGHAPKWAAFLFVLFSLHYSLFSFHYPAQLFRRRNNREKRKEKVAFLPLSKSIDFYLETWYNLFKD